MSAISLANTQRRATTVLLGLLLVVMSACGSTAESPTPQPDDTGNGSPSPVDGETGDGSPSPVAGELRQLEGRITIATEGSVPVPGAPPTARQEAWTAVIEAYRELQPDVEIEVEDLPAGQVADEFCRSRQEAGTMADLMLIQNCEGFRPSPAEIEAGTAIATDFKPFEDETNPYTGGAWKEDWLSDQVRLARCQESGAVDSWTCITDVLELKMIMVNWDVLNEFGVTEFPQTLTELFDLSDEINASDEFVAWDNHTARYFNFRNNTASILAMDMYEAAGGDPDNLAVNPLTGQPSPEAVVPWCDQTLWVSENPSAQEVLRQGERFIEANGGGEAFFDPSREQGRLWLTDRAAFWWMSSYEDMPVMNQAIEDGTFLVEDWGLEYLPDFTEDELFNPDTEISFDGKYMVEFGGQGDNFAPLPHVRESGEDENVDLIVRDFLQFLSSPRGQQRIDDQGLIPVNPEVFSSVDPQWVEAIETLVPESAELYQGATQPPGAWINRLRQWDPERVEESWLRGDVDFETFLRTADENITREGVRRLGDDLEQWGLTELPEVCQPWDT